MEFWICTKDQQSDSVFQKDCDLPYDCQDAFCFQSKKGPEREKNIRKKILFAISWSEYLKTTPGPFGHIVRAP